MILKHMFYSLSNELLKYFTSLQTLQITYHENHKFYNEYHLSQHVDKIHFPLISKSTVPKKTIIGIHLILVADLSGV